MPFSLIVTAVIALVWHIVLSRMRPGWRLTAVGGARRSAYNAGIKVRRTVCSAYIWSSVLSALAGFLYAARIGSAGADTGVGLEVSALTAAVLGGNSLGGGRGSVAKAVMGALLVLIVTDSLTSFGVSGPVNSTVLGCVLLAAVFVDMRFLRNRDKWLSKVYVSPAYLALPPAPSALDPHSPYALNAKLRSVEIIGLGQIEGRRTSFWTETTTCTAARVTATSCASSARTISATRSSRISAAIRSAWPSTARAIFSSASAAWASTAWRPTKR